MRRIVFGLLAMIALGFVMPSAAMSQPPPGKAATKKAQGGPAVDYLPANEVSITWYATLARGLAEAERTGKPILFVSAAPHCAGVAGMW